MWIAALITAIATVTAAVVGAVGSGVSSNNLSEAMKFKALAEFQGKKVEGLSKNTDTAIIAYAILILGIVIYLNNL